MKIQWYGHSCFLLTTDSGIRILTDPCAPTTGYQLHDIECDLITSSHSHYDHNYFVAAKGDPEVLTDTGAERDGLTITAVKTFHDDALGKQRGSNTVFCFETSGLRIVHMGDFGEAEIRRETAEEIGRPDVLLCPVGGVYTVDAEGALKVAETLQPKILIPMHYQTPALTFELGTLDSFLNESRGWDVQRLNGTDCVITGVTIPEKKRIVIFEYQKC